MSFVSDLRVLYNLAIKPVRGATHAERMESFYGQQAGDYDSFRERLLPGRRELIELLRLRPEQSWVDLGGGTGSNLDLIPSVVTDLSHVSVVDLSASLLQQARMRIQHHDWTHVETVHADATQFEPAAPVDVATCSYSLTMIPDWFAAVDRAWQMLKPGGVFGVVDFYVSRKHVESSYRAHGWFTRTFWPTWFATDNVFLSPDHVRYLQHRFDTVYFSERITRLPYVPLSRVPYYLFVGRKPLHAGERQEVQADITPEQNTANAVA